MFLSCEGKNVGIVVLAPSEVLLERQDIVTSFAQRWSNCSPGNVDVEEKAHLLLWRWNMDDLGERELACPFLQRSVVLRDDRVDLTRELAVICLGDADVKLLHGWMILDKRLVGRIILKHPDEFPDVETASQQPGPTTTLGSAKGNTWIPPTTLRFVSQRFQDGSLRESGLACQSCQAGV